MNKQTGQVILILILVITIALAIGLSVIQKSLVDVSTSTKVEQSARAFSAAEAGIEKAIQADSAIPQIDLGNNSLVQSVGKNSVPAQVAAGSSQGPLEYPPLAKEDIAQVWLADLNSTSNPPAPFYTQNTLDVYWGSSSSDRAALVLTLVYYDGTKYTSRKWYLDHTAEGSRASAAGFQTVSCGGHTLGTKTYQCYEKLGDNSPSTDTPLPTTGLMLLRARLLYNSTSQPLAVQAVGTCDSGCSLPTQARLFTSIGISGETQRKVQVFRLDKVVPPYFDYAIFSAGEIKK